MFSLKVPRRGRGVAVGVAAALVSALLVSVPVSSAVADDAPGFLVESGAYPEGAAVGAAAGIVLKDGNGGLRVVTCATGTGQVEVEFEKAGKKAKVCFETVFRPAVLNLEIAASFGVKAGKQPMDVTYSVAGAPEKELPVPANGRRTVDELQTGQSTVVKIEVDAVSTDVPATTTTHPRTASTKIRTGLGSCTGTLVDRSWVLTAASCFAADPATLVAGAPAAPARVLFGPDVANDKTMSGTGDLGVKITHLEPAGNGQDAVLAKLEAPVDDITPMPIATTAPVAGQDIAFTGFGRTASVWVPLAAHTNTYPVTAVNATTVTGSASGASLCLGDGGAPGVRDVNGTKTLVAVASQASQAGCYGSGIPAGTGSVTATRGDIIAPWVATTIENGRKLAGISAAQVLEIENISQAGACVTTKDRNTGVGSVIVGVVCTEVWQQRRWELVEVTPTVFALRNYVNRDKCIAADAAGTGVVQAVCATTDPKQQWTFREQRAGAVSIVNAASGNVLSAPTATTLSLRADTGANADRWKYRNVTKMRYDAATIGSYVSLRTAVGGKSVVAGAASAQVTVGDVVANSPLATRTASTFRVVAGLVDAQCYSFESLTVPGQYLTMNIGGLVTVSAPTVPYRATWCAEDAAFGQGVTFSTATDPWRVMRSHSNGLVYGGASWYAGIPIADDTQNFVPDTAWTIGEAWAPPTLAPAQVLELESVAQSGKCVTAKDRSAVAGAVIVAVGCSEVWQVRQWELIESGAGAFALRNTVTRTLCLGSADAAGSAVVQAPCDLTDAKQRWSFTTLPSGVVTVLNAGSGKALAAPTAGTVALAAPVAASPQQQWRYRNATQMRYDIAPVGSLVSLRTAETGKSLSATAGGAQATIPMLTDASPLSARTDATFRVVPGLANPQCYSFESLSAPGRYLYLNVGESISVAAPTVPYRATWCAEDAAFGKGLTFSISSDSWRVLRSHKNGLVYGGVSWWTGVPNADDTQNYIPDVAWTIGAPWVTAP
ncbi:Alpha-L-arabinofuranosidase B (ABFB) [Microbacterium oxydans]|uniref:Alpha-L-arabinofuranosidase B (ABFB) n=1 Tax=Microbacterium oxydans TaxID=82380 RepID=A0A0F0KYQ3_9MICO|nr:AbfB domain-containing protein [Microbacterium oxydans]KJL25230.1 Alpha-L-arabinofuranosidase B (ABFB) [Microbacterium oxydans]